VSDYAFSRSVMRRIRARVDSSGMNLQEFGERMGYVTSAKQSAWQFLSFTTDPRLSMLVKAAVALGTTVEELISEETLASDTAPR
jgi:transcriptional regulator with XRE-family HTH domain